MHADPLAAVRVAANRPAVIFDVQDEQAVLIDLESGHYFRLDRDATRLWTLLAGPTTLEAVAAACENRDELEPELTAIADDLVARGLLREARPEDGDDPIVPAWRYGGFGLDEFTDLEDILGLDPIHEADPELGWPHTSAGA